MNWFEDQLRNRLQNDKDDFSEAFCELSSIVVGEEAAKLGLVTPRSKTHNAVHEILRFFKQDIIPVPEDINDMSGYLDYCLNPTGIMKRRVELSGKWWRDAYGPMLAILENGSAVALLPSQKGYAYFDYGKGKKIIVNASNAKGIKTDAYCFYKPFPNRPLSVLDLIKHVFGMVTMGDIFFYLSVLAICTIMGLIQPKLTQYLYSYVIPSGSAGILSALAVVLVSMAIATQVLKLSQNLIMNRLTFMLFNTVEPAAMMRVLGLPPGFFKQYASGELYQKFSLISSISNSIFTIITGTLLTTLFSMAYFIQISNITSALLLPSVLIIAVTLALNIITTMVSMRIQKRQIIAQAELSGVTYSMLTGITKIKLTGSEKRVFNKWATKYKQAANFSYNPPFILKYAGVISSAVTSAGLALIYFVTIASDIAMAEYMAFNVSYGMVSASVLSLSSLVKFFAELKPMLEIVAPILKAEPESTGDKTVLRDLRGSIEAHNLSFRYQESDKNVIDGLSIKIRPGQYVALVGKTGCGKSTLVRLMLGFEKASRGTIYYDGMDIAKIDLPSLRRNIGTVLQSGKLFSGDIFSNITMSAPGLSMDGAWEAARLAGIDEDIKDMPMGMHTMITEGNGSISGGQKQRLMIARAVAPKPKILIFDESTSALDNITQKHVADSLSNLRCTRIVIAHRLSTIKDCDRIYVLDQGKIAEEGTFDELYANKGFFYELVSRQAIGDADG